jgi:Replication initiator protein, pSAM2
LTLDLIARWRCNWPMCCGQRFKTYTAPDGKTFRPSMFVTLTCPSYGRVREDGTPADPASYDYGRAARDALHFAALFDRFIQNLRRFLGYDVQYFAAVEPQRRRSTAHPYRDARHRLPRRTAPRPGRDLPPGVVARHEHSPLRR